MESGIDQVINRIFCAILTIAGVRGSEKLVTLKEAGKERFTNKSDRVDAGFVYGLQT